MANTTVADWLFLSPGDATLPHLGAGGGFTVQSAEVPADAQTDGFIAFTYLTDRGHDSSVDIQFSVGAGQLRHGRSSSRACTPQ